MELTIGRLGRSPAPTPEDERALTAIYEASFPPDERVPVVELLSSIAAGDRLAWVARLDGTIAGMAMIIPLDGTDVALLEYLAVDPARRSTGIGARLLGAIRAELPEARPGIESVILEVEPPDEGTADERVQRRRRVAFYTANGASAVYTDGRYRAPALGEEGTRGYDLLAFPLAPTGGPPVIEGDRLRACVAAILRQSYDVAAGDPLVAEVVSGLPAEAPA